MVIDLLQNLRDKWNQRDYQPLLEDDVAGWLFHTALSSADFVLNGEHIHLNA
jgi:hypothetical protein